MTNFKGKQTSLVPPALLKLKLLPQAISMQTKPLHIALTPSPVDRTTWGLFGLLCMAPRIIKCPRFFVKDQTINDVEEWIEVL